MEFLVLWIVGISLHNFPEGMAVFLGSMKVALAWLYWFQNTGWILREMILTKNCKYILLLKPFLIFLGTKYVFV